MSAATQYVLLPEMDGSVSPFLTYPSLCEGIGGGVSSQS